MKLTPLQMIVMFVVLAGIVYGTYAATMDQLPDITGTVMGSTTGSSNVTNDSIGTVYVQEDSNENISVIIRKSTKIYKENEENKQVEANMNQLKKGAKVEVHTIGDATDTIPPQIVAEKIIIKKSSK
ncbi:MAG: hypothetical protein BZ135_05490 [Methanosphaera sp. rholeuAM6]|nr:MAG: hypothetical protein BZ135_05490 [Methanosphaera sp. rholeuAM6]